MTHSAFAQFQQVCRNHPRAIALECGQDRVSYATLHDMTTSIGARIAAAGVTPGALLGIFLPRDVRLPATILASLGAGTVYVPLTEKYPPERLREIIAAHDIRQVVTTAELAAQLPPSCGKIILPAGGMAPADWQPAGERPADAPVYVVFTSGSTGTPKGVLIGEHNLANLIDWYRSSFTDAQRRSVLASTQITFDLSVFELICTLCTGSKVVLVDTILALLDEGASFDVSMINTVPSAARELVRHRRFPPGTEVVNLAGEALYQDLVDDIYAVAPQVAQVFNLYGPSEDTTYSTGYAVPRHDASRTVSIGRSLPGKHAYILSADLTPVEPGEVGEIVLGGAGVALGYLNDAGLTAEKFPTIDRGPLKGRRVYRTGDLGRYDGDGLLRYLGRADRQVKVRGVRIEPGEVEVALRSIDGVADAAVVKVLDLARNDQLVALIVAQPHCPPLDAVLDRLQTQIPAFMVPSRIESIDAIPLNANGKTDRTRLEQYAGALFGTAPADGAAPVDDGIEDKVLGIVSKLMSRQDISADTDFFRVGGNSLLSAQLTFVLQKEFAVSLNIADVFQRRTIRALAAVIRERTRKAPDTAPPARRPQPEPDAGRAAAAEAGFATAAQRGIWLLENSPGGRAVSNAPLVFEYAGVLDRALLERCLQQLTDRHAILRSNYVWENGNLRMRVGGHSPFELRTLDLTSMQPDERQAKADEWIAQEVMRPFDLRRDPMLRATDIRFNAAAGRLVFVFHHIAVDDRALNLLFTELQRLYDAGGDPAALGAAPVRQFADYAAASRQAGETLGANLAYWTRKLADYRGATPYLVDPAVRPASRFAGRLHFHAVPQAIGRTLDAAAAQRALTPFALFTAAVACLVQKASGSDDVCIGTFFSNRDHFTENELVGFFVNTLPLRVRIDPAWNGEQLAQAVSATIADAHSHRNVTTEDVFDALQINNTLRRTAFRVMVNLEPEQAEVLTMGALTARRMPLDRHVAKYDLLFSLRKEEGDYRVLVEYNTDLYDADVVPRICANLDKVLAALTNPADVRLDSIALSNPLEPAGDAAPVGVADIDFRAAVRAIWADEVGSQAFGDDDNFFDVGGSSLKIMTVYEKLSNLLKDHGVEKEIDIVDLFEHVTVAMLSDYLHGLIEHDALAQ
ncbi:non-ribosomal peptide synthetase [Burkholderia ambifaria]|uniref:non-ribosomal peptide synthetase n=1 Tax=Burkholderia ambifaria TaxID=152480 RepID=UPI0015885F54|nr:non-ribosomal peptide synthetase [Burkholderia ambifaria]